MRADPQRPATAPTSRSKIPRARPMPGRRRSTSAMPTRSTMADRHAIIKNGCKEIAWAQGQGDHLHGQMAATAAGVLVPYPPVAVERWTASRCSYDKKAEHGMSDLMRHYLAGLLAPCQRDHLFPRALRQLLQALHGRHLRADQGRLVDRQPHRRLPAVRRRAPRRSASNAASAAPTSTPIWPWPRCSRPASTASRTS